MDHYESVNTAWPSDLPPLAGDEAVRAANRLYRHFGSSRHRRLPRRCWISSSAPHNTIRKGWRRLVHDVSHSTWTDMSPASRDHNHHHANLELDMVLYVMKMGWLGGALKTKPREVTAPTPDQKLAGVLAAIKRWETKSKRAETALKKLRRRAQYYQRMSVVA